VRSTAIEVAWSVCLCVCLSVLWSLATIRSSAKTIEPIEMPLELCRLVEARGTMFCPGERIPQGKKHFFGGVILGKPRLARGRYSQRYSLEGRSDAASVYQSTVATC